jgi:hypothetical protein
MITRTLYPTKDTYIWLDVPTTNLGTETVLRIQGEATDLKCRILLEQSITWGTDIPSDAVITSATLYLYYYENYGYDPTGRTYWCDRLLRLDWAETQATWNIYKTGSYWTTAGCDSDGNDFTSTGRASVVMPFGWLTWITWDVLAQVQWAQTNNKNIAFRIRDSDETGTSDKLAEFHSSDYTTDPSLRPKLVITYLGGPFPVHFNV